jgi:CBS domain-containing protein
VTERIRDVMTHGLVGLPARTSVADAALRMREDGIGDVLVLEGEEVRGILTDRDIVVRAVAEGRAPEGVRIGDICSRELATVGPDDTLDEAVRIMRSRAIRRLPVMEGGRPVGIVSLGDLAQRRDPTSALADISAARANA